MEIPITIRQVTLSDLEEIRALQEATFPVEEIVSLQSLKESIRKSADTFLVARDENELVGYILGGVPAVPHSQQQRDIAIQSLVIHPDHRDQGLGTLLLASLKQAAVEMGCKTIRLTCSDDLLSYFEMNGFVEEEQTEILHASSFEWNLIWVNPFYQEEV